jgi:hypothetical protein
MGSWRKAYGQFGAVALVLAIVAGCSNSGATWPAFPTSPGNPLNSGGSVGSAVPEASGVRVILPAASQAAVTQASPSAGPRATAGAATVDQITADYTYKDELITPIAHLYGTFLDDFVIVTIKNGNSSPVKVVVTSQVTDYTDQATDTVTVDANGSQEVRQNPRLTTTAIDGLNSEHQADLHVTVAYLDNGQPRTVLDQTSETLVTSRDDFPWSITGFSQQDNYDLIVAMVTPTDPSVEKLIRDAANYDPSGAMTSGYETQDDSDGSVWQRLADIWQSETTDFKLTYISTTITFASGSSQRIRLPGEVLDTSSGNCIELTLLYASAVEALGMQPAIIIIPGHAYLAVRLDDTNDSYYFIETTMIGQATFTQAAKEGNKEWTDAQPHVAAGETDYGWVDVATQRQNGIVPIPWR